MFFLDKLLVDMRINLRSADVGMPEKFLQNAQVHARFEAMRRKTMAERVRRDLLAQVHGMQLHNFPCPHAAHGFSSRIKNDIVRCRMRERARIFNPGS